MQPEDKTEMDPTGMQIQLTVDRKVSPSASIVLSGRLIESKQLARTDAFTHANLLNT